MANTIETQVTEEIVESGVATVTNTVSGKTIVTGGIGLILVGVVGYGTYKLINKVRIAKAQKEAENGIIDGEATEVNYTEVGEIKVVEE